MSGKSSLPDRLFLVANSLFFIAVGLVCLIPWIHLIAKSVSDESAVIAGKVFLWPVEIHWDSYEFVLFKSGFVNALSISLFVTVVGTSLSLVFTTLTAYPLSKPRLKGRNLFIMIYVFAMLFYGGIVPNYMLVKGLGLMNTVWSMMIPYLIIPFNVFIMKTFFEQIPEQLEESAKIDGASNLTILFRLILPISLPSLATIGLFYAVAFWNDYLHPLFYINKTNLKPLQLFLYEMIKGIENLRLEGDPERAMNITTATIESATIVLSALPIMILYPFLQKYFVKGLTIGSVKG
ncbi:carbohydrate ABC transporter permease [Paenibacillus thalictri]|uniref:Carbohydrate ABC transporter permease n=1 Tax=Paenibacillus thalictri TaxID=2527873 RepID=A0A4Q9DL43_9BACL|nr:carbohydrate ABC transporter permease [Paenibacillus thalictri]TBL75681.1 carbohydrate ABC transporter permease [Paenibacillus thalictri]